ncbi:hypothetical protein SAMN05421773_101688 [Streptomyces aidingensis]|uniref:DUF5753 domain-containing protein n=2 Tax=Streptomyces aidingensis TaxID=910347 RepID=A0A1I1FED5_9ACTN|nr:hypothetical protein SAMN05421773_101688 [Streptomyces aidingensis]
MVVGVLQTPDYARNIFTRYATLHRSPRDTEEAVRARIQRQELLRVPGKQFHILQGEAALYARVCPPEALAAQLDRLVLALSLDAVSLGIVPFNAELAVPPANAFWIHDDRLVIVEDWHAELWLDDAENVSLYLRVWESLRASAVYGPEAHRLLARAKRSLAPR